MSQSVSTEADSTWRSYAHNAPRGVGVRIATARDVEHIAEVGLRTYPMAHQDVMDPLTLTAQAQLHYSREELTHQISDPRSVFLLSTWNGYPTGYAQLMVTPSWAAAPTSESTELRALYVKPDWVGNGVGEQLLRAATKAAAERGAIELWVGVPRVSRKTLTFFERFGFQRRGAEIRILGNETFAFVTLSTRLGDGGPLT